MPPDTPIRQVFISFHEQDIAYKERFVAMMGRYMVNRAIDTGSIVDSGLPLDEIRRRIRDDYIAEAAFTVVLIGRCTWQRKHVDWEISSSLRQTRSNGGVRASGDSLAQSHGFPLLRLQPAFDASPAGGQLRWK